MRYSVESNASAPISVNGLFIHQLPISRQGATEFTYSRFLVPWLMDFEGYGLFCDEDQVVTGDVWELFGHCRKIKGDWDVAVMKGQPEFEWPSVMVFNNERLTHMTPEFVQDSANRFFDFSWAKDIAEIPAEWNHFCGHATPREDAKLYHYSQGIPYWPETRGLEEDHFWFEAFESSMKSGKWIEFHADTIHFKPVMQRFLKANYGLRMGQ